ncbi:hypothetical protein [Pseudomonas sp. MWU15-20650]|uniref:hypothetical protein n=1 Tax=Pseudomonas sp. MWU15-20650 TaxID=2933107 RepID=UPI00200E0A51|nr:hypothetical protein [Pseudomonas sp. MWU15-20650]
MSVNAVGALNPVIINRQSPAQTPPAATAKGDQATNATASTPAPSSPSTSATPSAASAVAAALKEATETAAQTAQEAGHGDRQAQRLVQQHQHHSTVAPTAAVVNGSGQITGELINTKA